MGGVYIEYYNSHDEYVFSHILFDQPIPSLKHLVEKYNEVGEYKMKVYKNDKVKFTISKLMNSDYIIICSYKIYKPNSLVENVTNTLMPLERIMEFYILLDAQGNMISASYEKANLSFYKRNLHGVQIFESFGTKYSYEYNHGRLVKACQYTGKLFSFGTKLVEVAKGEVSSHEYTLRCISREILGLYKN